MTGQFQVVIEALREDASSWRGVAQVTRSASATAGDLDLTEHEMSWAATSSGLLGTYGEIQRKLERLLREATSNFERTADALDDVARRYAKVDEENQGNFEQKSNRLPD